MDTLTRAQRLVTPFLMLPINYCQSWEEVNTTPVVEDGRIVRSSHVEFVDPLTLNADLRNSDFSLENLFLTGSFEKLRVSSPSGTPMSVSDSIDDLDFDLENIKND